MKKFCLHRRSGPRTALAFLAGLVFAAVLLPTAGRAQTVTLVDMDTHVWRFNDTGTDLGAAWRNTVYTNEASWKIGTALFGVEETVPSPYPVPFRSAVVYGGNRLTHYFRTHFTVGVNPASQTVVATAYVDDGAVFYLNGAEVGRVRLTNDPVYFTNRAQVASPEGLAFTINVPSSALVQGDNVFAVEVHQNASASADVVFGLKVESTGVAAPVILTPNEPADRAVPQGGSTLLSVVGSGNPAPAYFWYKDNVFIPDANGPSLALNNMVETEAGAYHVVLSNLAGTVASRVAQVSYIADTNAPGILYAYWLPDEIGSELGPGRIRLMYTEAPNQDSAQDPFNWEVINAADGSAGPFLTSAPVQDGTNQTFTVAARDPGVRYALRILFEIPDIYGNALPGGTVIPVATYTNNPIPLDLSHPWRFEQSGADLGAAWRSNSFNDGAWSSGAAPLDAFRSFPGSPPPLCREDILLPGAIAVRVNTCLSLSNANNSAQRSATYFRTHFTFAGDATNSVLHLESFVDDGAVFYLNGKELCRLGLADGPVANSTLANRSVLTPAFETLELDADGLLQGDNLLAVEVHQDSLTSGDLTMGLRLSVIVPELITAPQLSVGFAAGNITVSWTPAVGRLQAATDIAGPWSDVTPNLSPNSHSEPATGARKFFRVVNP